jgi:hypothetical protein
VPARETSFALAAGTSHRSNDKSFHLIVSNFALWVKNRLA